jgi:hypothetical protein
MKVLIVISFLAPALVFADRCPDLSGKYMIQSEDGQVHLAIDQDECLQITIERTTNHSGAKATKEKHTFALDGVLHPGAWNGAPEGGRSSAKFVSGKLELTVASATGEVISKETWQLLPDKSIEIKDMTGRTMLAKKQRR